MQSSDGSSASTFQPTQGSERIVTLDILRGIALFGVLAANIWLWFSGVNFLFPAVLSELRRLSVDSVVFVFISIFISGKAIRTFSFLFGLGFALQMMRAESRGQGVGLVYSRRLIVLLTFGIIHAVVFWYGDILTAYALLGFGLLLFRRATQRTLLVWAAVLIFAVPIASSSVPLIRSIAAASAGSPPSSASESLQNRNQRLLGLFASAQPAQIVEGNLLMLRRMYLTPEAIINYLNLFGFFLLGLFAGRVRVFENPMVYRQQLRRLVLWGFAIGVIVTLAQIGLRMRFGGPAAAALPWFPLAMSATMVIGTTPFALAYIAAATLLLEQRRWKTLLGIFAPVGRMALTNYLAQTLICLAIYYVGGLFGSFRPALGLLIAMIIFVVQIGYSTWLGRYRFGPMEWLWRSLTYGHMQPMRIPRPDPVPAAILS